MTRTAQIGCISSGTLRPEDLISTFVSELESLDKAKLYADLVTTSHNWLEENEDNRDEGSGSELVNELIDALDDYAPDYAHFGASEGDPADFGFWPSIESLEDDARSGSPAVIKVDAGDEPVWIMSVNDHGNVTLYRVKLEEVWSCV